MSVFRVAIPPGSGEQRKNIAISAAVMRTWESPVGSDSGEVADAGAVVEGPSQLTRGADSKPLVYGSSEWVTKVSSVSHLMK